MNKKNLIVVFILITQISFSQVFDTEIEKVIRHVSQQLNNKGANLKIAIYPIKHRKNNEDVLAEYITEEFWDKLPNAATSFSVMDRGTFDEYFQEHILATEGLIDPKTEKQFGMLIAADAYVSGKAYVFNSVINLRVKVTNTQTGEILATGSNKLPITYDMAEYMELKGWKDKKRESEKGKSGNPNCEAQKRGDICFENTSDSMSYIIRIQDIGTLSSMFRHISVAPKKFGCFKDLPEKGFYYSISKTSKGKQRPILTNKSGNFYIKRCQSDVIKL